MWPYFHQCQSSSTLSYKPQHPTIPLFALTKGWRSKRQLSKPFMLVTLKPLSTRLIKPNFYFHLSYRRSTTVSVVIIYMKKFLHADWLTACQLIPNSARTLNFFECRKTKLVQKVEIKLIDRKVAKEKLTDGQSNLLFSNQVHALDCAIHGAIFPWLRDTRAFLLLGIVCVVSCIVSVANHKLCQERYRVSPENLFCQEMHVN